MRQTEALNTIRPMPRTRRLSIRQREALWGYAFVLPWVIGFLAFSAIPIAASIYFGFTDYSVLTSPKWVGLDNYVKIFTDDKLFAKSLGNTLFYVAIAVPGQLLIAFGAALLLNQKVRGLTFWRSAFYLPVVVPYIVSSVLFLWILEPQVGVLKYALGKVGIASPQ